MGLIDDVKNLLKPPPIGTPPTLIRYGLIMLIPLTILPFAVVANMRVSKMDQPRIHIFQDMDNQPRFKAQSAAEFWADSRAMRKPVAGTVARGKLHASDPLHRGLNTEPGVTYTYDRTSGLWTIDGEQQADMSNVPYVEGYPEGITVDEAFIRRGAEKFAVNCAVCHGYSGHGDGMVHQAALRLSEVPNQVQGWVQPVSLVQRDPETGEPLYMEPTYPNGQLYNVIVNGARSMYGYGDQITDVEDRWAIVAYIRALQISQIGVPVDQADVPTERLKQLKQELDAQQD